MKIIDALLQLKQCFAEHEGEILQITLDENALKGLHRECPFFMATNDLCRCCQLREGFPSNKLLGIEIKKE